MTLLPLVLWLAVAGALALVLLPQRPRHASPGERLIAGMILDDRSWRDAQLHELACFRRRHGYVGFGDPRMIGLNDGQALGTDGRHAALARASAHTYAHTDQ